MSLLLEHRVNSVVGKTYYKVLIMSDEQLKRDLIKQMGSENNETALIAVDKLREKGWLTNGSLRDADLRDANLRGANLFGAYLTEAILNGVDLSNANLSNAYLIDTDLRNAELSHTDLSSADLSDANLSGADLRNANLRGANLFGADLSNANLRGANLFGANLTNADISEARCGHTIFADVDLSEVKDLDTILHYYPSILGIDTLYKSRGSIPDVFLRGCGVPDKMITFAKSLVNSPIDFYSCFISYNHKDKSFARRVHDTLQGRGIRCWLDEKQMLPGDDIYEEIDRGIRYWDKILLCCSENSLSSWWVDNEIDTAFNKERHIMREQGKKILALIPLDLDGHLHSKQYESGKKRQLRSRISANFKGWESDNDLFDQEIEKVIRALQTEGAKEEPPEPKLGKH